MFLVGTRKQPDVTVGYPLRFDGRVVPNRRWLPLQLRGQGQRPVCLAKLAYEVLDNRVAVSEQRNVKRVMRYRISVDQDLRNRMRDVRHELRYRSDLSSDEISRGLIELTIWLLTLNEVPITINRSTSSRSLSKQRSNSSDSISLQAGGQNTNPAHCNL